MAVYYHSAPRERPPERRSGLSVDTTVWLTRFVLALLAVGVAGGIYYYYFWTVRLPQERTLTDQQGKTVLARLEGRAKGILKYVLPPDPMPHYLNLADLAEADQKFVKRLPENLALKFPFEFALKGPDGKPQAVLLDGRNERWLKYIVAADRSIHYLPLANLTTAEQSVVRAVPAHFSAQYPVEFALADGAGAAVPVVIEGQDGRWMKYRLKDDPTVRYRELASLTPLDRDFVQLLQNVIIFNYPISYTLTDQSGQPLPVRIEDRSLDLVRITPLADGRTQWLAIESLNENDRNFISQLPSHARIGYPVDHVFNPAKGTPVPATVEGRSNDALRVTLNADGSTRYLSIAALVDVDQRFARLLPVSFTPSFPLECTLTDQNGRALPVVVLGRTTDAVKFTVASSSQAHIYALNQLSSMDQAFLKSLPANLDASKVVVDSQASLQAAIVQNMRDRIDALNKDIEDQQARMGRPSMSAIDRGLMQIRIKKDLQEVDSLNASLRATHTQ